MNVMDYIYLKSYHFWKSFGSSHVYIFFPLLNFPTWDKEFSQVRTYAYVLIFINVSTCGGLQDFVHHLEFEFVIIFLMGLNEAFGTIQAH